MKSFDYVRPVTVREAVAAAAQPGAAYLAAGTNLLDLMKGGVTNPKRIVDPRRGPSRRRRPHRGTGPQCRSRERSRFRATLFPPSPRRSCRVLARSFVMPQPSAAISCSGRVAHISTMRCRNRGRSRPARNCTRDVPPPARPRARPGERT
jgi:FAD binding domain in molybdopterin dehydrogenase